MVDRRSGWAILRLEGEIDVDNAWPVIRGPLVGVDNTDEGLVVDLSRVTYIDSAGMRMLLGIRTDLAERRQQVVMVLPESSVLRRALEVGGIIALIPAYPTEDDALAAGSV